MPNVSLYDEVLPGMGPFQTIVPTELMQDATIRRFLSVFPVVSQTPGTIYCWALWRTARKMAGRFLLELQDIDISQVEAWTYKLLVINLWHQKDVGYFPFHVSFHNGPLPLFERYLFLTSVRLQWVKANMDVRATWWYQRRGFRNLLTDCALLHYDLLATIRDVPAEAVSDMHQQHGYSIVRQYEHWRALAVKVAKQLEEAGRLK